MSSITALDANWAGRPHAIAAALLESPGPAGRLHRAIIDPGPTSTLDTVRHRLQERGLSVQDLDVILLTHIHLDHAGATGSLVRENPRLTVYVHERGAPHMADPAILLHSAGRLWGDQLTVLFGEMLAVPSKNLRILKGGETLTLGAYKLDVVYTPGHASHHVSYFDHHEGIAFVGDTAGIRIENGPFTLPATPPPDINLELWDASFDAILARRPARLFLTHYGYAENPAEHIAVFRERLHAWLEMADEMIRSTPDERQASEKFTAQARAEIERYLSPADIDLYVFAAGLDLSFLGLARHLRKRAQKAAPETLR